MCPLGVKRLVCLWLSRKGDLGRLVFGSGWQTTGVMVKGVRFLLLLSFTDIINKNNLCPGCGGGLIVCSLSACGPISAPTKIYL